jgi:hypothetical protein
VNEDEIAAALTFIERSWERGRVADWEVVWVEPLAALPAEVALAALRSLQRTMTYPPTVADLYLAAATELGLIPPDAEGIAGEEWAKVARDAIYSNRPVPEAPHLAIAQGVSAFGGVEAVMDDRKGWRRFWRAYRAERVQWATTPEAIRAAAVGRALGAANVMPIEAAVSEGRVPRNPAL